MNDGSADFNDLDSDNDGRLDVIEAGLSDSNEDGFSDSGRTDSPRNTDGVDQPDYRDLDSNNDGTFDIVGTGAFQFDHNGDGQIDAIYARDDEGDGVANLVDGEPNIIGVAFDSDGDGIDNAVDGDDDNDGIPDLYELINGANIDTDNDGIVDRLDLDSDNDGIPDSIEGIGNVSEIFNLLAFVFIPDNIQELGNVALDADGNGVLDDTTDSNGDGIIDLIASVPPAVDTDGDGRPDFRDLDTDDDGLTDLAEASLIATILDVNKDGILDAQLDLDRDGLRDIVDPDVAGGTAGSPHALPDSDNNDLLDYRDYTETSFLPTTESLEPPTRSDIKTGGGSIGALYLLMLIVISVCRHPNALKHV